MIRLARPVAQLAIVVLLLWPHFPLAAASAPARHEPGAAAGSPTFHFPAGLAVGPAGSVYVADAGNARVVEMTPAGRIVRQWPVAAMHVFTLIPGYFEPVLLAVDAQGDIYLGSHMWQHLYRLLPGGSVQRFGPRLIGVDGIAAGPRGNVMVVNGTRRLIKLDPTGRLIKLDPTGRVLGTRDLRNLQGGSPLGLQGVTVDSRGNTYVASGYSIADTVCGKYCEFTEYYWIQEIRYTSRIVRSWMWHEYGAGGLNRPGSNVPALLAAVAPGKVVAALDGDNTAYGPDDSKVQVRFGEIRGMAADSWGHIFVLDGSTGAVVEVTIDGQVLGQWGGGAVSSQFLRPRWRAPSELPRQPGILVRAGINDSAARAKG